MCKCKNEKEKVRTKNARIYKKKKVQEVKNYTQALREVKCAYTKKNHFSLEVNTAILEALILNFRAKGIEYFGPLKTKKLHFHLFLLSQD